MKKYFCASDIHSFYDEWIISLKSKGFELNNPEHIIIVCGDLFDRGSQSVECFEFIQDMHKQGRLVYVRGNHEDLLTDCVTGIRRRAHFGSHHVSNGTVKTIAHFLNCSEYAVLCDVFDNHTFDEFCTTVLDWINSVTVDYFQLGDKVFVHGWVPTTADENNHEIVHHNWRDGGWNKARWECGFDCWRCNLVPPQGETVVCGHWHASYGWSEFRGRSEWGPDAEFTPFIDNKIIALDACTVYTHMVNVVVFDEGGNLIT